MNCLQQSMHQEAFEPATSVRLATPDDRAEWDRFADSAPGGSLFHRFAWGDVLQSTFGYQPLYLIAERGPAVVGILPLAHKRSAFFGDIVSSLPFCSYGGPLGIDQDAVTALVARGQELAHDLGVDVIELRGETPSSDGWVPRNQAYATFQKDLPETPDEIIRTIPYKGRRHAVRSSLTNGLTFECGDNLADFYRVISESYRNLGTPVFPRRYFETLLATFPGEVHSNVVRFGRTPIAAAVTFAFRDALHPVYAGGTAAARPMRANDFLFFKLMCTAQQLGLKQFDFGRSRVGSGNFDYKKFWGYSPQPLTYHYKLVRGKQIPHLSPTNPRYSALVSAWKRLPLSVSRTLGPALARHLG